MPRNVATPQQSAQAEQVVQNLRNQNKFNRTRPLTKFEREALNAPIEAVYMYNISPIWKWQKDYPGLGTLTLFPRRSEQQYSDAIVLEKRMVRAFDGGNRIQRLMVETPLEIVEDFLVCSRDYPGRPQNNLLEFGCFYTVGQPIEDVPAKERQVILDDAELKHRNKCLEFVGQADALASSPNMQAMVVEVHRKCALFLGEERDWVQRRAKLNPTEECPFCGFDNRRGVAKCKNCAEILDLKLYETLKAKHASKS